MKLWHFLLCVVLWGKAEAQSIDPVSLLLTKAIKTLDLKVQRLQNETLVLQRLQQVAEEELVKVKMDEIHHWQQQLSDLYEGYFAELKQVKPALSRLPMVKSVVGLFEQVQLEYNKFPNNTGSDVLLDNSKAISRMLASVLGNQLSMKDGERLKMLFLLRYKMLQCLESLQALNKEQLAKAENSIKRKTELKELKRLHGIQ